MYAHDPDKQCKTGDYVLIRELDQRLTRVITHEVVKVVYKYGDMVEPTTGRKCVYNRYRDQDKDINQIFGELETAFDYDKAPERGWQEGKRDFTDKETYAEYHVFDKKDPYSI